MVLSRACPEFVVLTLTAKVEWYGRFGYKSLADKDCTVDGGPPLHFWAMAT